MRAFGDERLHGVIGDRVPTGTSVDLCLSAWPIPSVNSIRLGVLATLRGCRHGVMTA